MKRKIKIILLSVFVFFAILAGTYYMETRNPEKIFEAAWGSMFHVRMDANFIRHFAQDRKSFKAGELTVFNEKVKKFVPTESFVTYFTRHEINKYEKQLNEVKRLNPRKDGKALVQAAIDLYELMDNLYKIDFLQVAEMIDAGMPDEEIDAHLEKLNIAKEQQIVTKYNKLEHLLIEYADKHGIQYVE